MLRDKKLLKMYTNMRTSCYSQNTRAFKYVQWTDVRMDPDWEIDRDSFLRWATEQGWKEGMRLVRINEHLGYTPSNCKFVQPKRKPTIPKIVFIKQPGLFTKWMTKLSRWMSAA